MRAPRCLPSPPNLSSAVCCVMGREQAKIRASHLDFPSYTGGGFRRGDNGGTPLWPNSHFADVRVASRRDGTAENPLLVFYSSTITPVTLQRVDSALRAEWVEQDGAYSETTIRFILFFPLSSRFPPPLLSCHRAFATLLFRCWTAVYTVTTGIMVCSSGADGPRVRGGPRRRCGSAFVSRPMMT